MDNGLLSNHHSLKEHEGSFCSKCNLFYFSKISKCNECDSITEPKKWYSRFCLERIIFIITLSIISIAVVPFITSNADAQWLVPLLTALILFSAYHTAQYFLGIGGGFKEKFQPDDVPERALKTFSFKRYFSEFFRLIFQLGLV